MVGTADIVADRFGCMATEKNRPRVANPGKQGLRIRDGQFKMFGREPVDQGRRIVQVANNDDRAMCLPARAGNVSGCKGSQLALNRSRHAIREID